MNALFIYLGAKTKDMRYCRATNPSEEIIGADWWPDTLFDNATNCSVHP